MNDLDQEEYVTHGWPSGLRRMTEATGFLRVMRGGYSGVVIHAWVRIQLRAYTLEVWVGEQHDCSARFLLDMQHESGLRECEVLKYGRQSGLGRQTETSGLPRVQQPDCPSYHSWVGLAETSDAMQEYHVNMFFAIRMISALASVVLYIIAYFLVRHHALKVNHQVTAEVKDEVEVELRIKLCSTVTSDS
ncbi:unnamed protein product [Toxocara canis]|uniref:GPS domain-containing protein n=1 Tax=Toxocara canis TaxID=6265 RepID=A0A183VG06_TOXCA|nr:unnamed protein product [Toxocara canis]